MTGNVSRFHGVYLAHTTKEDVLCTLNFAPGKTVYGEKRISVDVPVGIGVYCLIVGNCWREEGVQTVESFPLEAGCCHYCMQLSGFYLRIGRYW